jgi:branched-chain amino acid transport system ATP-binding protein
MTVLDNVTSGLRVSAAADRAGTVGRMLGLPGSARRDRASRDTALAHLQALGIAAYAHNLPAGLPYASRKRVALARALIAEPRLLLLDEPAAGLDADEIAGLAAVIRGLPKRPGRPCTVMLVDHRMDLVMRVCDTITVLDAGRVIATGTPDEIRSSDAVIGAYLGPEPAAGETARIPHR